MQLGGLHFCQIKAILFGQGGRSATCAESPRQAWLCRTDCEALAEARQQQQKQGFFGTASAAEGRGALCSAALDVVPGLQATPIAVCQKLPGIGHQRGWDFYSRP